MSQATCKNSNKTASCEGFLIYLTEPTFTLAPIINAWIQFPGTKEINPNDTTTASEIIVIDSGQSWASVRVPVNIPRKSMVEEVDYARVAEKRKLHKARSVTVIHIREGPVEKKASSLPYPALI